MTSKKTADARCACFNLRKASRAVTQYFEAALEPSGLKATQFSLLMVIQGLGTASLGRLAGALVMDRTTLTRNLRPLEKMNLVRIRTGADPRVREVSLTAAGKHKVEQGRCLWKPAQAKLTRGMGDGPFATLIEGLDRVVSLARGNSANPD